MKKRPFKPWRSYTEQLQLIESRGLTVDDRKKAEAYLRRVGYYRLSGYWYPLRQIDKIASEAQKSPVRLDEFEQGSRFDDVVRLYVFDKKLRLHALDALERIELAVRVDIAHLLGKRHPLAYREAKFFDGRFTEMPKNGTARHQDGRFTKRPKKETTRHEDWLKKYENLQNRARHEPFVRHHMERYGHLPIWAAIELWDFGLLSHLFWGMRREDRDKIARIYDAKNGRVFAQWLHSLNFIRNVSAHHSRLWNINVTVSSNVPDTWPSELRKERPFFYFSLMQHLLIKISPKSSWGERFHQLIEKEFPSSFRIEDFGAYHGWEEWSLWQIRHPKRAR